MDLPLKNIRKELQQTYILRKNENIPLSKSSFKTKISLTLISIKYIQKAFISLVS